MGGPCFYCGVTVEELSAEGREMRPYGPGGSNVCNPCVRSDPARMRAAQAVYGALLYAAASASPDDTAVVGTPEGPQPFVRPTPTGDESQ